MGIIILMLHNGYTVYYRHRARKYPKYQSSLCILMQKDSKYFLLCHTGRMGERHTNSKHVENNLCIVSLDFLKLIP